MRRTWRMWARRPPPDRVPVQPHASDAVEGGPAGPAGRGEAAPGRGEPLTRPPGRVLLFMTTQAALRAEDALLDASVEVDVVPKPEGVRGLCGIALLVPAAQLQSATMVLDSGDIPFEVYEAGTGSPA